MSSAADKGKSRAKPQGARESPVSRRQTRSATGHLPAARYPFGPSKPTVSRTTSAASEASNASVAQSLPGTFFFNNPTFASTSNVIVSPTPQRSGPPSFIRSFGEEDDLYIDVNPDQDAPEDFANSSQIFDASDVEESEGYDTAHSSPEETPENPHFPTTTLDTPAHSPLATIREEVAGACSPDP